MSDPQRDVAPTSDRPVAFGLLEIGDRRVGIDLRYLTEVCMIDRIAPLISGASEVLGVIDLRGTMIPILDPRRLCGLDVVPDPPRIAAMLESGGRTIGLGIDRIAGLTEADHGKVQSLYPAASGGGLVTGGFFHDGHTVSCLDPEVLFARADLPAAASSLRTQRQGIPADTQAYLTFRTGGATFGLEALKISGTVPRRRIPPDPLTTDLCLGSIRQHGRRIPVMQASAILGLGRSDPPESPEVVVVRFPDDRLLGLAVDVICRIALIRSADLQPVGPAFDGSDVPFRSVLVDTDGAQTFVLDHEALTRSKALSAMAALSDRDRAAEGRSTEPAGAPARHGAEHGPSEVHHDRARYLVFTAGQRMATPITQLVQILEPPRDVTPLPQPGGLLGLFSVGGRLVPLVCLARRLGRAPGQDRDSRRVLLVGAPDHRVGFLVDSVNGIETSEWWAEDRSALVADEGVVKLRQEPTVLLKVDLDRFARETSIARAVPA